MKLSEMQQFIVWTLEASANHQLSDESFCGHEKRSLAALEQAGLIYQINYANGLHWCLTDAGLEWIAKKEKEFPNKKFEGALI